MGKLERYEYLVKNVYLHFRVLHGGLEAIAPYSRFFLSEI
jgi:hypothetical protein